MQNQEMAGVGRTRDMVKTTSIQQNLAQSAESPTSPVISSADSEMNVQTEPMGIVPVLNSEFLCELGSFYEIFINIFIPNYLSFVRKVS